MFAEKKPKQSGVTLLELIIAMGLMTLLLVGLSSLTDQFGVDQKNSLTAGHLKVVAEAGRAYTKDNFQAITSVATDTTPAYISVANLVSGGYLQPGFSARNSYGQDLCILVLEPTPNKLQGLVVSEGGTVIGDIDLGAIVAAAGGSAGAIRSSAPNAITGTQGGWSIARAAYHNLANSQGLRCNGSAGAVQLNTGSIAYALWLDAANDAFMTQWKDPVANVTLLPASGNNNGDTRLVIDLNRTYTWQSGAWYANGLTNEGFMRGPNNATFVNQGDSCAGAPVGSLAKDAAGNLYVCN
jgi:type II secretory pathway pseudopilin PulG